MHIYIYSVLLQRVAITSGAWLVQNPVTARMHVMTSPDIALPSAIWDGLETIVKQVTIN